MRHGRIRGALIAGVVALAVSAWLASRLPLPAPRLSPDGTTLARRMTLTLLPGTGYTLMESQPPSATGYIVDGNQPIVDVSVADTGSAPTARRRANSAKAGPTRRASTPPALSTCRNPASTRGTSWR